MPTFVVPRLELITPEVAKRPLFISFGITLAIIISSGAYYIFAQPELPLLYTLARPNQALIGKEWIFLFPSISFLLSVLHVVIVHLMRELEPILLVTFARSGLVLQILLLAEVLRIVYITI